MIIWDTTHSQNAGVVDNMGYDAFAECGVLGYDLRME